MIKILEGIEEDSVCRLSISNSLLHKWYIEKKSDGVPFTQKLNDHSSQLLVISSEQAIENRLRVRATLVYQKIKSANRTKRDLYKTQQSIITIFNGEVVHHGKIPSQQQHSEQLSELKELRFVYKQYVL